MVYKSKCVWPPGFNIKEQYLLNLKIIIYQRKIKLKERKKEPERVLYDYKEEYIVLKTGQGIYQ